MPPSNNSRSSPRKRGGGFTLEVQHLREGLGWGAPVKAFSWGVVVGRQQGVESLIWQEDEVGLARQEAAHAADGIFDAALLPGSIAVAEEGLKAEPVQQAMTGELGAVVEGQGSAQRRRQVGKHVDELIGDEIGGLTGWADPEQQARVPLVQAQHGLAVFCEQHQVGFPVTWGVPIGGLGRALGDGNAAFNQAYRTAAAAAAEASFAFAARQVVAPAIVLGAGDLGVDEAVDALVTDDLVTGVAGQTAGDLLGGPAFGQAVTHGAAQVGLPFEARAHPAPRPRLFLGICWFVADVVAAIALYLTSDRRWRAIQSCRNLPDRAPIGLKTGNFAAVLQ
jgi:hypothetical protein